MMKTGLIASTLANRTPLEESIMQHSRLLIIGLLSLIPVIQAHGSQDVNELGTNHEYAMMQECLASAEQTHNLESQLDRYCIDSFLATHITPDNRVPD